VRSHAERTWEAEAEAGAGAGAPRTPTERPAQWVELPAGEAPRDGEIPRRAPPVGARERPSGRWGPRVGEAPPAQVQPSEPERAPARQPARFSGAARDCVRGSPGLRFRVQAVRQRALEQEPATAGHEPAPVLPRSPAWERAGGTPHPRDALRTRRCRRHSGPSPRLLAPWRDQPDRP
jgi:hypothetical protein